MKGVIPFGPLLEGAGLNITVLSNMGNVDFGVIGCRELVPDIWDIADGFVTAVAALAPLPHPHPRKSRSKRSRGAAIYAGSGVGSPGSGRRRLD